jgi:uncharacterized membrane protein YbhN (UPF0104 family)
MPVQRVFFSTQAITALGILSLIIFFLTPFLIAKWSVRRQAIGVPSENYVRISIHLLIAQILLAISWIFLGIGLWFTSRIFYETSSSDITYFIFSTVLGFLVSLAVVFVPNGWGVREVTLAVLLQPVLPSAIAVACSIMFRLIVVLVEIACIVPLPVLIYRKTRT